MSTDAPTSSAGSLLRPHGRVWEEATCINQDQLAFDVANVEPEINWNDSLFFHDRRPIDYFKQFYPMRTLGLTLQSVNQRMAAKNYSPPLEVDEFFRFLGIRLIMALEPRRGGYSAYWKNHNVSKQAFSIFDMEALSGMRLHRFEQILECVAFCDIHDGMTENDVSCISCVYSL